MNRLTLGMLVCLAAVLAGCTVRLTASDKDLCAADDAARYATRTDFHGAGVIPTTAASKQVRQVFGSSAPWRTKRLVDRQPPISKESLSVAYRAIRGDGPREDSKAKQDLREEWIGVARQFVPWLTDYTEVSELPPSYVAAAKAARQTLVDLTGLIDAGDGTTATAVFSGYMDEPREFEFSRVDSRLVAEIASVYSSGGYDAMTINALGALVQLSSRTAAGDQVDDEFFSALWELNAGRFMGEYLRAYFRGGRMIQVSLDQKALGENLTTSVAKAIGANEKVTKKISEQISAFMSHACNGSGTPETCLLTRALGSTAFVTRAGLEVQFSGISAAIGPEGSFKPQVTLPEAADYGPQLVRVALEAVFDAQGPQVPAAANATACAKSATGSQLYEPANCLTEIDPSERAKKIQKLDEYGNQAEATVSGPAGQVVRGVWAVALNNDAVANSVETLAGVLARKVTEKFLWAKYEKTTCHKGPSLLAFDVD